MEFIEVGTPVTEREHDGWIMLDTNSINVTPTALMNDEILLQIFLFAASSDNLPHSSSTCRDRLSQQTCGNCLGFIQISHVCRRWRRVALATAALWTRAAFTLSNSDAIEAMLARTASMRQPLELSIAVTKATDVSRVLNALIYSRTVDVSFNRSLRSPLYQVFVDIVCAVCTVGSHLLQEVSLSSSQRGHPKSVPEQLKYITLEAPALCKLQLNSIWVPWQSPNLTSLSISGPVGRGRSFPLSADVLLGCLEASPKLESISISSSLHQIEFIDSPDASVIELPQLKVLHVCDVTGPCLALLSRLILPADVYIEAIMATEQPVVEHFEYGLQPHIQNLLSLGYLSSLSVDASQHLTFTILSIGFDDKWQPTEALSANNRPGSGVRIEFPTHQSTPASFSTYMLFANRWLFPHTPLVLRLEVFPDENLMPVQWMEYLDPFTAVDTLCFPTYDRQQSSLNLIRTLISRPTRILPNLTSLVIKTADPYTSDQVALRELEQLITELAVSRLQTGREAVIGRVRLEGPPDEAYLARFAERLRTYVPDVELVSAVGK